MLGGTGIVIAGLVYFFWRSSSKPWQRTVARIALVLSLASFGMLCLVAMYS